jgi:nicotinamide-nucleotide amidase
MDSLTDLTRTLGAALLQAKQTVAVAESSAAGLISAALLAVPGASAFYRGGVVCYTIYARQALLGITDAEMAGMRASTEPYALLLAKKVRERLGTDWGVGETGATGPTGNRYGDAAGHACIAVIGPGTERVLTLESRQRGREPNMWCFTRAALELLEDSVAPSR